MSNSDFDFIAVSPSTTAPRAAFPPPQTHTLPPAVSGAEITDPVVSAPSSGYDHRRNTREHLQHAACLDHEFVRLREILRNPAATPHDLYVARLQLKNLQILADGIF